MNNYDDDDNDDDDDDDDVAARHSVPFTFSIRVLRPILRRKRQIRWCLSPSQSTPNPPAPHAVSGAGTVYRSISGGMRMEMKYKNEIGKKWHIFDEGEY